MKTSFDISEKLRVEVSDFNGQHDLGIYYKQPRGEWIITGAVVLTNAQAIALAVYLINKTPEAIKILKPKFLSEDNEEHRKSTIKRKPKTTPSRTLMESLLSPGGK